MQADSLWASDFFLRSGTDPLILFFNTCCHTDPEVNLVYATMLTHTLKISVQFPVDLIPISYHVQSGQLVTLTFSNAQKYPFDSRPLEGVALCE